MGRRRRRYHGSRETPPGVKAILTLLGVLGALFMALLALGLSLSALPVLTIAFAEGNLIVVVEGLALIILGVVSVAVAGTHPVRGLPFHATGIGAPFVLGSAFSFLADLQIFGGVLYAAAFCWSVLGDLVIGICVLRAGGGRFE